MRLSVGKMVVLVVLSLCFHQYFAQSAPIRIYSLEEKGTHLQSIVGQREEASDLGKAHESAEEESLLIKRSPPKIDLNETPEDQDDQTSNGAELEADHPPVTYSSQQYLPYDRYNHPQLKVAHHQAPVVPTYPYYQYNSAQGLAYKPYHPFINQISSSPSPSSHLSNQPHPAFDLNEEAACDHATAFHYGDTRNFYSHGYPQQQVKAVRPGGNPFNLAGFAADLEDPHQDESAENNRFSYTTSSSRQPWRASEWQEGSSHGRQGHPQLVHQDASSSDTMQHGSSTSQTAPDVHQPQRPVIAPPLVSETLLRKGYPASGGHGMILKHWYDLSHSERFRYETLGWVPEVILNISKFKGKKVNEGRKRKTEGQYDNRPPRSTDRSGAFLAGRLSGEEKVDYLINRNVWGSTSPSLHFWIPASAKNKKTPKDAAVLARDRLVALGLESADYSTRKAMLEEVYKEEGLQETYHGHIEQQAKTLVRGLKRVRDKMTKAANVNP